MNKKVTIVTEVTTTYEVVVGPGEKLTDNRAKEIIRLRRKLNMPLGILDTSEKIISMKVED